jgi:glycosyltransferase involved in cell wall biosynthesis
VNYDSDSGVRRDPETPLVSIICLVFNHARHVEHTLQGFLDQEVDFPVEILIHDDASTDGTADIIREYVLKHPEIIKPVFQTENQYTKGISPESFLTPRARGRYLAFCEGDDYWTDPQKLQKQVSILERDPNVGLVYTDHSVYMEDSGTTISSYIDSQFPHLQTGIIEPPSGYVFEKLLLKNFVSTLTVVLRRSIFIEAREQLVGWLPTKILRDFAYWLEVSRRCHFFYLDDVTAMYRIHKGTMSRPDDDYDKSLFLRAAYEIVAHFFERYNVNTDTRRAYYGVFFSKYLNQLFKLKSHYRFSSRELELFEPSCLKDRILKLVHKNTSARWPYVVVESIFRLPRRLGA